MNGALGKLLYGALFVVALPALLVAWARATSSIVTLPSLHSLPIGAAIGGTGALLMVSGWWALYRHGGGLPMNAFPPPRYVTQGAYGVAHHPIYVGACALAFGVSIALGSRSGFWLVSPALVLASTALVLGYEKHDLEARFGSLGSRGDEPASRLADARPWLSIAPDDDASPNIAERLAIYPMVLLIWGALYEAIAIAGAPPDARSTLFAFEQHWPVFERTEAIYALTYPLVLIAPLVARSRRDLRAVAVRGLLASALVFPLYLALPFISPPRPFTPEGPLGALLAMERGLDTEACAFPSFHVIWALIAAEAWASRFRGRIIWRGLAIAIAASCVTTGMHSLADVIAGGLAFLAVERRASIWEAIRAASERVANSWQERRIGRARVINHGGWAALSTFGGIVITGTLVGSEHLPSAFVAALAGLVCAALWAQIIEGSPSLLRPYGFYGGVLGVVLGSLAAPLTGTRVWLLLSAYAVAAPFIQSAGRLRCLVQGCCHGHEAPPAIGIRYTHPRSRVCRLSTLGGVPVHPTPLYSILWNVATALVVGRLWMVHAPLHFIGGVYIALNGLGRFVEEAYRGEPQTPIYARLRFYQWVALATVIAGATVTAAFTSAPAPTPELGWASVAVGAVFGAISWFALGVDFPESNRRFARLV